MDAQDAVQDNDADFLSVQIEQPPVFKILYMANTLDWDWRFFSKLHEDVPSMQASALIRLGELPTGESPQPKPRFFTENVASDITEFPENTDFYAPFDAVVADVDLGTVERVALVPVGLGANSREVYSS